MDLRAYILQRCEELRAHMLRPALQDPLIRGLLQLLPPIGAPFPRRRQWIEAMGATLAILYEEDKT